MKSILAIDDEEQMVCVVREILENEGHQVLAASNGEEGLRLFGLGPADLVITDIFMAEKDGLETLRALRRLSPTAEVIAMSGGCSKVEGFQALDFAQAMGAHTLKKPFDLHDMLDVGKTMLESVTLGQLQVFRCVVEKVGRHVSSCPYDSTQALLTTYSTCVYYNDIELKTQCIECRPGTGMEIETERGGWGLPLCEPHSSFMNPEITIEPEFGTIPLSSSVPHGSFETRSSYGRLL